MKHIPLRRCIVNNQMLPKEELFRIVKTRDGEVLLDISNKIDGRGAYIKKEASSITKAKQKHILNKAFSMDVADSIYEEMLKALEKE